MGGGGGWGGAAAMIKAPVGAAPVLFLTRTSRGESQRESKVSPLTQSQRLIYAPPQFPATAANQDVVKVVAQLFFRGGGGFFCHRPRGRGAEGPLEADQSRGTVVGCLFFLLWLFFS